MRMRTIQIVHSSAIRFASIFGNQKLESALFGLSFLILAVTVFSAGAQGPAGELVKVLKLFPGYHVQTLKELDPDTRSYFVEHYPRVRTGPNGWCFP